MAVFGFVPVQQGIWGLLGILIDYLTIAVFFVFIWMILQLFTGGEGLGKIGDWFKGKDHKNKNGTNGDDSEGTSDGGKKNGPEDTSSEYGDWAEGFGTVTIVVYDEDDNPIQGANVTLKHRKLPKMHRKMNGYTGTNGTYGPKRIPAGQIMVKATHRNFLQYAITTLAGRALLGGSLLGVAAGAVAGVGWFGTDRYAMKDWFFLEKDKEETFVIRLKRKKGQKDTGFEPKIISVTTHNDRVNLHGRID
jgi:hypothetical protein